MAQEIDHDRLFKELLTTFFYEFIELFLPRVAEYLDRDHIEFLDKEVFTDVTAGDRHEADLVAKVRFRGRGEAFFLIHVETQSSAEPEFARRMFRYFARLHEKFGLPVYPIALFSYDAPQRLEPDRYQVRFPDKTVLDFSFEAIQLNRLNWRDFVRQPNPVASALMAKMRIPLVDRIKVKVECLRLLVTLRLDRARMGLIWGFIDSYLKTTAPEDKLIADELGHEIAATEQETPMELVTSIGMLMQRRMLLRQIQKRFGQLPPDFESALDWVEHPHLEELGEALFDLKDLDETRAWILSHQSPEAPR